MYGGYNTKKHQYAIINPISKEIASKSAQEDEKINGPTICINEHIKSVDEYLNRKFTEINTLPSYAKTLRSIDKKIKEVEEKYLNDKLLFEEAFEKKCNNYTMFMSENNSFKDRLSTMKHYCSIANNEHEKKINKIISLLEDKRIIYSKIFLCMQYRKLGKNGGIHKDKKIIFTNHTNERSQERGISNEMIEDTAKNPDRVNYDTFSCTKNGTIDYTNIARVVQKTYQSDNKFKTVKVIFNPETSAIITVIKKTVK